MKIRLATIADIDSILKIVDDARELISKLGFRQWTKESGYPSNSDFQKDIKENSLYVLEDNSLIIGMMALYVGLDENYDYIEDGSWLTNNKSYLTIHRLAVKKEYYGGKASKILFNYAFNYAKEKNLSIRIDTHPDNLPMNKLLKKLGFYYCGHIYIKKEKIEPIRNAYEVIIK